MNRKRIIAGISLLTLAGVILYLRRRHRANIVNELKAEQVSEHGICYDFFFVTGYMYTEKKAGEKIKSAAQGLFTFATYGLGMFIGTQISGRVVDKYALAEGHNWKNIWFVPAYIALGVLIYFILFFREKRQIQVAGVTKEITAPEVA